VDGAFPPLYTEDLLAAYARQARALQAALGRPLLLEPVPTYLTLPIAALGEIEFVSRLLADTGCGLRLDVGSAWLSAHQAGLAPRAFVGALPLARVVELQVTAVGPDPDLGGPWLAAGLPGPAILDLARFAAERAPGLRAVTFDVGASAPGGELLEAGVRLFRDRLGRPP
jgi:Protein of unknown function (DUF692)